MDLGATLLVLLYFIELGTPNDVACRVRAVGLFHSVPVTSTSDLRQPFFLHSLPPPQRRIRIISSPYLSYLHFMIRAGWGIYVTSTHEPASARALHAYTHYWCKVLPSSFLLLSFWVSCHAVSVYSLFRFKFPSCLVLRDSFRSNCTTTTNYYKFSLFPFHSLYLVGRLTLPLGFAYASSSHTYIRIRTYVFSTFDGSSSSSSQRLTCPTQHSSPSNSIQT
jgi:hypothetical protein